MFCSSLEKGIEMIVYICLIVLGLTNIFLLLNLMQIDKIYDKRTSFMQKEIRELKRKIENPTYSGEEVEDEK